MSILKKKRVDTGIRNNPSTGDVLADGGDKINVNFDSIYNAFGDMRKFTINQGIDEQYIHATGYYQKLPQETYAKIVDIGSRHDIDTSSGSFVMRLPRGVAGEGIELINSNGSLNVGRELTVRTDDLDAFVGGSKDKIFRSPYSKITIWCVKVENGVGTWNYKVENLFGDSFSPIDEDVYITTSGEDFTICSVHDYKIVKLLCSYTSIDGRESSASEVFLHLNSNLRKVMTTEHSMLSTSEDDLYTIDFRVENEVVKCKVKSNTGKSAKFKIKAIEAV